MVNFDTTTSKPNHEFMKIKAEEWAKRGFLFDPETWEYMIETVTELEQQLLNLGLSNPNSDKEVELFLRSFNSLEIASELYDIKRGRWDLSVKSLQKASKRYFPVSELKILADYKKARAEASSFITLSRQLTEENLAFPKVSTTLTNRLMFVEPNITGLPKRTKPFLPHNPDSVLVSVDIKAQEPSLIIHFFGSEKLKEALSVDSDHYCGVARLAFTPKVKCFQSKSDLEDNLTVSAVSCGHWEFDNHDYIVEIENIYGEPKVAVKALCASGNSVMLPVTWCEGEGTIITDNLNYVLSEDERAEVKSVWNITAYGGSYATVKSLCKIIDSETLSRFIRANIRAQDIDKNSLFTSFGTKLVRERGKSWSSVLLNTIIQGTGADLMALLVENFYATPETEREGIEIYFTRYDELVLEVTEECFKKHGSRDLQIKIQDLFEHTINNELKFTLDIKMF